MQENLRYAYYLSQEMFTEIIIIMVSGFFEVFFFSFDGIYLLQLANLVKIEVN